MSAIISYLTSNALVAVAGGMGAIIVGLLASNWWQKWRMKIAHDNQIETVIDMHQESAKDLQQINQEVSDAKADDDDYSYVNKPID